MSQRSPPTSSLTRRDVVKRAVAVAALGGSSTLVARDVAAAVCRHRVAIIGAGAGGITAAYFLAGTHAVDLFSVPSSFTRTRTRSTSRSLSNLGSTTQPIRTPARRSKAPGSLCIFPTPGGKPDSSSAHPLATLPLSLQFAAYTQLARHAVLSDMSWETTVDEWVRRLPVSRSFKHEIVYPWTSALIGSPRADALRASARSILQTFALTFPANVAGGATTYNSKIGLQGTLQRMLDRSPSVRVYVNAATLALTRRRGGWFVQTRKGERGPYRFADLNAPPQTGQELLGKLPAFAQVTALLNKYEYFDSRLLVHTDPTYVQRDRANWAAYNAGVDGRECEGSVWHGALQHKLPSARRSTSLVVGRAPAPGSEAHPAGATVHAPRHQPLRRSERLVPCAG